MGEVSAVNDDETDNYFIEPAGLRAGLQADRIWRRRAAMTGSSPPATVYMEKLRMRPRPLAQMAGEFAAGAVVRHLSTPRRVREFQQGDGAVDKVPKLPDEHLDKAKEMVLRHRRRSTCKACYDRGHQGINELNMLVTCPKCVDGEALMEEWRAYVRETPALAEMYGDYFEEGEEGEEEVVETRPERGSPRLNPAGESSPGRRPPRAGLRWRPQSER